MSGVAGGRFRLRGNAGALRLPVAVVLTAVALLWQSQAAQAMRVVEFDIFVDRKLVLEWHGFDKGEAPDVVWGYLKTAKFALPRNRKFGAKPDPEEIAEIVPDPADPRRATLVGKVHIYSRYGGIVDVDSLKLVRSTAGADEWQVAPEEIDRTSKLRTVDFNAKSSRGD